MGPSIDATDDAAGSREGIGVITVIIPAYNESARIEATVTAAASVAGVSRVIVVDDGSTDRTSQVARDSGAQVVGLTKNEGKAAAMEYGFQAATSGGGSDEQVNVLVFVDADLESTAKHLGTLAAPVLSGEADMTVATLPQQLTSGGGRGFVVRLAHDGIRQATGWAATQPLSGQRAVSASAFRAALPLAAGWGVEVGMTIDLLNRGFRLMEVEVPFHHRVSGKDWRAQLHRGRQFFGVWRALRARSVGPRFPVPR
jgi:glycosyltransferase involved in cell wall biosynthesis